MPLIFFAFLNDLGNFKQKKFSGIFKSTTISRTFECMTNSRTAEVQAQCSFYLYLGVHGTEARQGRTLHCK